MALEKTIVFTIQGNCNLSCYFCDLKYHKKSLTLGTIKEYLKDFKKEEVYVILSGGEPTINPQFGKILEYLETEGYKGQVITNGLKILEFMHLFNNFKINLSLSSLNMLLFDEKDMATWKVIPDIIKRHPQGPEGLNLSPVFRNNFEETKLLLDFAKANNIGMTMNVFTQISGNDEAYYHKRTETNLIELRKMIDYYTEIYTPKWWIEPETLEIYYDAYSKGEFKKCFPKLQMENDIHVMPDKTGNGYEESFCCLFEKTDENGLASCGGCLDICQEQNKRDWAGKRVH
jgi:organic radical activating enzyme